MDKKRRIHPRQWSYFRWLLPLLNHYWQIMKTKSKRFKITRRVRSKLNRPKFQKLRFFGTWFRIKNIIFLNLVWKFRHSSHTISSPWVTELTYVWIWWNSSLFGKRIITWSQFIWNKSCIGGVNWASLSQVAQVAIIVWDLNFENPYSNFKIKISRITKELKRTWTSKTFDSERIVLSRTCSDIWLIVIYNEIIFLVMSIKLSNLFYIYKLI